jgi:hypothetical protein
MQILLQGDPSLFNQYGVMAVNPEKHPQVKYKEAMTFIDWLFSRKASKPLPLTGMPTATSFSSPMPGEFCHRLGAGAPGRPRPGYPQGPGRSERP